MLRRTHVLVCMSSLFVLGEGRTRGAHVHAEDLSLHPQIQLSPYSLHSSTGCLRRFTGSLTALVQPKS